MKSTKTRSRRKTGTTGTGKMPQLHRERVTAMMSSWRRLQRDISAVQALSAEGWEQTYEGSECKDMILGSLPNDLRTVQGVLEAFGGVISSALPIGCDTDE